MSSLYRDTPGSVRRTAAGVTFLHHPFDPWSVYRADAGRSRGQYLEAFRDAMRFALLRWDPPARRARQLVPRLGIIASG